MPWYVTAGTPDWEGNLTAQMGLNGTSVTGGRWIYPDLWHTFTVDLPPFGETVQMVMLDTETLTGNNDYRPPNLPVDLYYPPAPARRALRDFDIKTAPPARRARHPCTLRATRSPCWHGMTVFLCRVFLAISLSCTASA